MYFELVTETKLNVEKQYKKATDKMNSTIDCFTDRVEKVENEFEAVRAVQMNVSEQYKTFGLEIEAQAK